MYKRQVTARVVLPLTATTAVGLLGTVAGVAGAELADGRLMPTAFRATTLITYAVPLVRPVTVHEVAVIGELGIYRVHDPATPPLLEYFTIYSMIFEPPLFAGATHVTPKLVLRLVATTDVGLSGTVAMLATCTGLPLLIVFVVTTAVRLPRDGVVLRVTINWVAVALVTVPVPLLKATVLLAAMVSNPVPSMVRVVAVTSRSLVFTVTDGTTVAVCPVKAMLFKSTLTLETLETLFAVIMSSLPSPFTSPKFTPRG